MLRVPASSCSTAASDQSARQVVRFAGADPGALAGYFAGAPLEARNGTVAHESLVPEGFAPQAALFASLPLRSGQPAAVTSLRWVPTAISLDLPRPKTKPCYGKWLTEDVANRVLCRLGGFPKVDLARTQSNKDVQFRPRYSPPAIPQVAGVLFSLFDCTPSNTDNARP